MTLSINRRNEWLSTKTAEPLPPVTNATRAALYEEKARQADEYAKAWTEAGNVEEAQSQRRIAEELREVARSLQARAA